MVNRLMQGPRPLAYGPTWDVMTPRERRSAFLTDLLVAISGALILYQIGQGVLSPWWLAAMPVILILAILIDLSGVLK